MNIPKEDHERIAALIHSADSPVGIDAKLTHIMILRKLELIESRLQKIEDQLADKAPTTEN
ncbi:MAG: hypothetical protein ACI9DF_005078 [Verrucomicrobiales bacterium]|jgi:hypothetical protein